MSSTLAYVGRKKKNTGNDSTTGAPSPPKTSESSRTETVRLESDLAQKLTMISIRRKIPVSDLLSPQVRAWIEEEYRLEVRKMSAEIESKANG